MKRTALITGASKGIGKELALILAEKGCDLVIVARSEILLLQLKHHIEEKYSSNVHVIVKNLGLPDAPQELFDEVKQAGIEVDYLINNAGFGDWGAFLDTSWERYGQMIDLNVTTLTHLCHLYVREWKTRKSGRILNISSLSAFQPGPMMAVYFATKSFVLQLSEALGHELKKHEITVTALCPGPTSTSFGDESGMKASQLVKSVKIATASDVARLGYNAMMKGKPVAINGVLNKLIPFAVRFMPRRMVTRISASLMDLPKKG